MESLCSFRGDHEIDVPPFDQPPHVWAQGPLDDSADRAEGGVERHNVDHPRSAVFVDETVLMLEAGERTLYLFIDEPDRPLEFDDATGHGPAKPKVSRSPRDVLPEPDLTRSDAIYRALLKLGHRANVSIDAQRRVEDAIDRSVDARCALESDGHGSSLPLSAAYQAGRGCWLTF